MIDFELSEEHEAVEKMVRDWAAARGGARRSTTSTASTASSAAS